MYVSPFLTVGIPLPSAHRPTLTLFRMNSERLPSTPQRVFAEPIPFRLVGYPGAQELW